MMDGGTYGQIMLPQVDAARLRRLAQDLLEAGKPGEGVFLSLGKHLEDSIGIIHGITADLENLTSIMDGGEVQGAADGLRQASDEVVGMVAALERERQQLDRLAAATSGGERAIGQLQKTVGEIGVLGMNSKIQLAHIAGANEEFANFTGEITRLASLASRDLQNLENGHSGICHLIEQARSDNAHFTNTHGPALLEIGQHLQLSLDLLEKQHRQSVASVQASCGHSAEIARLVGGAVVSLQVNDMTRQRIEHVAQALEKAADLLPGSAAEPVLEEDGQQLAGLICRLQSIHVVKTAEQFKTQVASLLSNLQTLADQADVMVREQLAFGDGETSSLFEQLDRQLREASSLYLEVAKARAGTRKLIKAISEGVELMTTSVIAVHEIEADIRIMGLNATLRCNRLGSQGRALAVIAQELRQCASRTQEQAKLVGGKLEALVQEADCLANLSHGERDAADAVDVMSNALRLLLTTQERFVAESDPLLQSGQKARALLVAAAGQTNVQDVLGDALQQIGTELDQIAQTCSCHENDERQLTERALTLLDARYTMASERDIHDLFLGSDVEPPVAVGASAGEVEIDDFLF